MRRIEAVTISAPLAPTASSMSLAIGITGGAEKKPRAELLAGNDERIGHLLHAPKFPSPLWGGVRGGGREATQRHDNFPAPLYAEGRLTTPLPTLPHKGEGSAD